MFYAHLELFKRGPLARIWLAAHWEPKITKAHVFKTNIEKSVDSILQPSVKLALRTSSHLLLGVVRIYLRKAEYLLADCNEASDKIKIAFRPGMIDLPEGHGIAAVTAITLPGVFYDFDTDIPELNDVDIEAQFSLNQSRVEEITMREDYDSLSLVTHDQGFGDMSFDSEPPELLRHGNGMKSPSSDQSHMLLSDGLGMEAALEQKEKEPVAGTSAAVQPMDIDTPIRDDGFGGHLGQDILTYLHDEFDDDMGDHFGRPRSSMGGMSSDGSRSATPAATGQEIDGRISVASQRFTPAAVIPEEHAIDNIEEPPPLQDQTTLLHDDEEGFVLPPIDEFSLKGLTKIKRKRKLVVDKVKNISNEEIRAQLSDTSDIVTTLNLAPPTKRLMHWRETGGVTKLFALPGSSIPARVLKNYQRHLTSKSYDHEDFGRLRSKEDSMAPEQMRDAPEEPSAFEQISILNKHRGQKRKATQDDDIIQPSQPLQPTPVDVSQSANAVETVEIPSMIAQHNLPAELSFEEPLPAEPSVSDISSIVPSREPSVIPPTTEISLLNSEIAPGEVSSLDTREEAQVAQEKTTIQPSVYGVCTDMEKINYDQQEEQQMDETYEQFAKERVSNKSAANMYHVIKSKLDTKDKLTFSDMILKNNRKQIAQKFYTLLVMKKFQIIKLHQEYSYGEIIVTKGSKFDK